MTDFDRLLAAIRENPGEDAPRLVWADWLEENAGTVECAACDGTRLVQHRSPRGANYDAMGSVENCPACRGTGRVSDGRAELAAFVRVQVELAARDGERCRCRECQPTGQHHNGPCRSPLKPLRARERELWGYLPTRNGVRSYFESTLPGAAFCPESDGGKHLGSGFPIVLIQRGLPAVVRCTLAEWMGGECGQCQGRGHRTLYGDGSGPWAKCQYCIDGHAPGIGPPLAQRWPIVAVETDVAIHKSGGNDTYYVGGLGMFPQKYWRQLEGHRTPSAARAALSAALIAEARGQSVDGGI